MPHVRAQIAAQLMHMQLQQQQAANQVPLLQARTGLVGAQTDLARTKQAQLGQLNPMQQLQKQYAEGAGDAAQQSYLSRVPSGLNLGAGPTQDAAQLDTQNSSLGNLLNQLVRGGTLPGNPQKGTEAMTQALATMGSVGNQRALDFLATKHSPDISLAPGATAYNVMSGKPEYTAPAKPGTTPESKDLVDAIRFMSLFKSPGLPLDMDEVSTTMKEFAKIKGMLSGTNAPVQAPASSNIKAIRVKGPEAPAQ